jgi:tetratricopeptide (TPR) repeat protein
MSARWRALSLGRVVLAFLLAGTWAPFVLAASTAETPGADAAPNAAPADAAQGVGAAKLHYLKGSELLAKHNPAGALTEFKAALRPIENRQGKNREQNPVYAEVRYGAAYAYLEVGQASNAVAVLDPLVAVSPRDGRARYLLGIALLRTGSVVDTRRGMNVLGLLAKEIPGQYGTAASHAASRYGYDVAIGAAATGSAAESASAVQTLRDNFGVFSSATAAEDQAFQFGMGWLESLAGNTAAALSELEGLKRQNPAYILRNGVTLQQVLSDLHYQAGLDLLGKGNQDSLRQALVELEIAERYGSGKEVDVHHGKALVYKRLDQPDKMAQELASILALDPGYYKRISPDN